MYFLSSTIIQWILSGNQFSCQALLFLTFTIFRRTEGYMGRTMKLRQVVVETKFLTVVVDRATKLVTAAVVWMHDGRRPNKRRLQQLGSQASPPLRRSQKLHCDGIVTLSMASFFYLCIKLDLAFTNRVEEQKQQRQLLLLASFPPLVKFRIHAMFDQRTRTEGS